jgi:hypothetical protein
MSKDVYEKFADKALQYLEGTEAFLKDQLPDYFQQVVKYHAIENWIYVGIGLLGAWIATSLARRGFRMAEADSCNESFLLPLTAAGFVGIFSFVLIVKSLPTALKATIAPKVFIVDYLRGKE